MHFERQKLPFKMHKIVFFSENSQNMCVPSLLKMFRPVTGNTLIFYLVSVSYTDVNLNAPLIITDFLAMIYIYEQPRTASLNIGWAILENDCNLICR